jgi:hypothetical protein
MECGDGVAALDSSGAWVNMKRIQGQELRTSEIELRAEGLHRDSVVGCDALENAAQRTRFDGTSPHISNSSCCNAV